MANFDNLLCPTYAPLKPLVDTSHYASNKIPAVSLANPQEHPIIKVSLLLPCTIDKLRLIMIRTHCAARTPSVTGFFIFGTITSETERNSLLPSVNSYHRSFCDQPHNRCYYSDVIHTANVMFYEREFPIERIFYPPLCGFFCAQAAGITSFRHTWRMMKAHARRYDSSPKACPRFISLAARAFLR